MQMEPYRLLRLLKLSKLLFPDPLLEAQFQKHYAQKFLSSTRSAMLLGAFLYSLFGIIDIWMLPQSYTYAWIIRYAIVLPYLLLVLLFSFTKHYNRFAHPLLGSVSLVAGLGIVMMVFLAEKHETGYHYYFIGLLLASMYTHISLRIQTRHAIFFTSLFIITYILTAIFKHGLHEESMHVLTGNIFFLLGIEAIGVAGGITIEYYQRNDFLQRKIIEARQEELEHEIKTASRIQRSILPGDNVYQDKHVAVSARYLPMVNVGGDFYDYKKIGEHQLGVIVADVSGHGIPAALIASMVKVSFQAATASWERPELVLKKMNTDLYFKTGFSFITAAYLCFNFKEKKCALAQAGHPPLFVQNRKNGRIKKYKPSGFPLGVLPENPAKREIFSFNSHDRFILYTDGLFEALEQCSADEDIEIADILETVKQANSPDQALNEINSILGLPREDCRDDITMLIADIHPPSPTK